MKIKKSIEYHLERINTIRKEIKEYLQENPRPQQTDSSQSGWSEFWTSYYNYHKKHDWYLSPRNEEIYRHIQDVNNWRMKNWIDYKIEMFCM